MTIKIKGGVDGNREAGSQVFRGQLAIRPQG